MIRVFRILRKTVLTVNSREVETIEENPEEKYCYEHIVGGRGGLARVETIHKYSSESRTPRETEGRERNGGRERRELRISSSLSSLANGSPGSA